MYGLVRRNFINHNILNKKRNIKYTINFWTLEIFSRKKKNMIFPRFQDHGKEIPFHL